MLNNKDENDATFGLFLKLTPFFCALMVIGIHSYNAGGGGSTKYYCTNRGKSLTWFIYSSSADFYVPFGISVFQKCK